jgi:hypothetical protein
VGSNSAGTAFGTQQTFTTAAVPTPTVVTLPATGVTATNATLNGTVNPNQLATFAYFQYGLTTNYGNFTATNSLPAANATLSFSSLISGLVPGAAYHYRLVAGNAFSTVMGLDQATEGPQVFTGAEPGQGLDLQGTFLYAVNLSGEPGAGLIGDANFTADNVSGVTITTPGNQLNSSYNWASPDFGPTTNGLRLTQVMSQDRWTGTVLTINLAGLQVGTSYRLQLLFIESYDDRVFNVAVNGTTIVPNFRILDYGPMGTPVVIPYVFTAASTNALIQLGGGTGGTDNFPQMSGFTLGVESQSVATLPASGINLTSATLNGTVNPNGAATIAYFQYGLTTSYGGFSATNILPATNVTLSVSDVISGLTPGATYYYQLVGSNSLGTVFGAQGTFTAATPLAPTVATLPAGSTTGTSATLNGTVNPNGAATTVYFQYGLTTSYGSFTVTNILPATNVTLLVSNMIGGLTQGMTYYYQLVGSNSAGINFGAQNTFTTLNPLAPEVTTLPASGVAGTSATLNGTVNPHDLAAIAYFQYGLTTNYGSFTAATNLPATNVTFSVSNLISGLMLGEAYHFRLVASNALGTVLGLDQSIGLISPRVFTGAEPGQGLDLQGSFLYAVNLGGDPGAGLIGDANFTAETVSGVTITAPGDTLNNSDGWADLDFGTTTNGLRLAQVMSDIRWTGSPAVLTINLAGLQVGASYRLQLLFTETYDDRVFNVAVNGATIVQNFRLLDYGPMGTPIVIPYVFTAASTNALIELGGGVGGNDNNPQISGFTLETLSSVTLTPFRIIQPTKLADGTFQLSFTNLTGASFRVFAATNVAQPTADWSSIGPATESPAGSGQFQFTDPQATNYQQRFYRVTSP